MPNGSAAVPSLPWQACFSAALTLQKGQWSEPDLPGDPLLRPPQAKGPLAACRQGCAPPEPTPLAPGSPMLGCWWVEEAGRDWLSLLLASGEKLMLPGKGGRGRSCGALCQSPPCGKGRESGCSGAAVVAVMPGLRPRSPSEPPPLLVSGLAFFSSVGADANVTTGHGTEGLTCGTAENCMGKAAALVPGCSGELASLDGRCGGEGWDGGWAGCFV